MNEHIIQTRLLNAVRDFISQCNSESEDKTLWIAYSGGLDSHVLLDICHALRHQIRMNLRAIHINHGLSLNAQTWANHCKKTCELYRVDYVERAIRLELHAGDSLEEKARELRYGIFSEYLANGDLLLTAHHQDDQAETFLLQLLRGAGPKGLASMPVMKSFGAGYHGRPLLDFSRDELLQYANGQQLQWVDDESNANLSFTRNFIRHEVLATLKSKWPAAASLISRSAAHCAENQMLIEEFSQDLYVQCKGSHEHSLSVSKLLQYTPEKQRSILRVWIQTLKYPVPDKRKIETIRGDVLTASWDSSPLVQWGDVALRRHRDELYLMKIRPEPNTQRIISWDLAQPLEIPEIGVLQARKITGDGLRTDIHHVTVSFRQGGEVIEIPGRGNLSLKNLFQEWNVLPWERNTIPLIFVGSKLIAVVGYFLHEAFSAKNDEWGLNLCLIPSP